MKSRSIVVFFFATLLAHAPFCTTLASGAGEIFVTEETGPQGSIDGFSTSGNVISTFPLQRDAAPFGVTASNSSVYVSDNGFSSISQYTLSGSPINQPLVSFDFLLYPRGITLGFNNLYAANYGSGEVSLFNAATGAVVNESFVALPRGYDPTDVAVSGNDLYVMSAVNGGVTYAVGEYNAITGAPINGSLVTGLPGSAEGYIAISGNDLFVSIGSAGRIGEYDATTGAVINASLITGLSYPAGIATYNGVLYIAIPGTEIGAAGAGKIAEYTTSGTLVNAAFASGLNDPQAIVVIPEPATWLTLAIGIAGLLVCGLRRRHLLSC